VGRKLPKSLSREPCGILTAPPPRKPRFRNFQLDTLSSGSSSSRLASKGFMVGLSDCDNELDPMSPPSSKDADPSRGPKELAIRWRDALLGVAKHEAWPTSEVLRMRLACTPEQLTHERATGRLLGIWSDEEHTYYYPALQFSKDGSVHPQLSELLSTLGTMPSFAPSQDPGGWQRLEWLYQPRGGLSERSVAERASDGGIAPNESSLAATARTPAEVFPIDASAVIALAYEDAERLGEFHG